jgi:hypothetical protein
VSAVALIETLPIVVVLLMPPKQEVRSKSTDKGKALRVIATRFFMPAEKSSLKFMLLLLSYWIVDL